MKQYLISEICAVLSFIYDCEELDFCGWNPISWVYEKYNIAETAVYTLFGDYNTRLLIVVTF